MNEQVKELAERLLHTGFDMLTERELRVLTRIATRIHISRDVHAEFEDKLTFGERLADKVAEFGGSWTFISIFGLLLAAWVVLNSFILLTGAFDPYPYIFLNLILSMLAEIQAPVIMMSQNRTTAKDRLAAAHDYEINLKAELEIMGLHEKLDQLRTQQVTELLRTQEEQIRLLTDLVEGKRDR
ncbi:MAG: DUF1003 domain-containing protein [Alphaproteobacteria bacterium]|nr:DUF1003 domain-containing protein [Alphaproteobacteria bacterium]